MEEIEPIPLQLVHEISETKEQIQKPLVIEAKGLLPKASKGLMVVKWNPLASLISN
jgi:hypothetical protein